MLLKIMKQLSPEEKIALAYFLEEKSVGTIIAEEDLKEWMSNPKNVIQTLLSKNLIVKGQGCYNLSPNLSRLSWETRKKIARSIKSVMVKTK